MIRVRWPRRLLAIVGVALLAAVAASALPDNPYQRWQLIEDTLYANATWSYERIHFDPAPIDVAILGASRAQMGLSAPRIEARLAARGMPLTVANLSVIEDGRNIEWAIADELFRVKQPKLLVVMVSETMNRWGHPGFKYVAPAAAVAFPPVALLHNSLSDLAYLPYRQLMLFAARLAPEALGLRDRFDPALFAAKTSDYSHSHVLADGKRIDMERSEPPAALLAEAQAFERSRKPSKLPRQVAAITDIDNQVYIARIAALARRHGTPVLFVYLPEYGVPPVIEGRPFYASLGTVEDDGDLARDASLFQSFTHLNRRGALIASDRLAESIARMLGTAAGTSDRATGQGGGTT